LKKPEGGGGEQRDRTGEKADYALKGRERKWTKRNQQEGGKVEDYYPLEEAYQKNGVNERFVLTKSTNLIPEREKQKTRVNLGANWPLT